MINLLSIFEKKNYKVAPTVLVVLDGFGEAPASRGNPIDLAKTPTLDYLKSNFAYTSLIASGESVGLPAGEVGNSEVGHLTIGAGRVILQHLKRINTSISEGAFFENKALLRMSSHVKTNNSALHIAGLASTGGVHSSIEHLYAILKFCVQNDINKVYLHLFTDGRDAAPEAGKGVIENVQKYLNDIKIGTIATISGRYFAMDRDRRWERVEKAYKAMVLGLGPQAPDAISAIKASYAKGVTDEFIEPTVIVKNGTPIATINDNDAFIFFNFRVDRPLELSMAFVIQNFENLKSFKFGYVPHKEKQEGEVKFSQTFKRTKVPKNLFYVTMTEYHKDLPVSAVMFGPIKVAMSLPEVLSLKGIPQMHIAESEKQSMVTYYFDGMREDLFSGEDVDIVASPKVPTYDKVPQMSSFKIVKEFKHAMAKDKYIFYIINFACPDMVAHTGNIQATVKAIETVDKSLSEISKIVGQAKGKLIITADHGNAEELLTYSGKNFFFTSAKGEVNTDHSSNPVPLIIADWNSQLPSKKPSKGSLSDVAPTILTLMKIPIPTEMTGKNLFEPIRAGTKLADGKEIPDIPDVAKTQVRQPIPVSSNQKGGVENA